MEYVGAVLGVVMGIVWFRSRLKRKRHGQLTTAIEGRHRITHKGGGF